MPRHKPLVPGHRVFGNFHWGNSVISSEITFYYSVCLEDVFSFGDGGCEEDR
jgi:hypothetical protein